jgi:hypothetical protein
MAPMTVGMNYGAVDSRKSKAKSEKGRESRQLRASIVVSVVYVAARGGKSRFLAALGMGGRRWSRRSTMVRLTVDSRMLRAGRRGEQPAVRPILIERGYL